MKFSIIIPAYNSERYIIKALESVQRQTNKDYELLVVCDSCTDRTEEVARNYGAKTFKVDYHLDGLTRNCGLDNAHGDWVLFMDDDDWWTNQYVLENLSGMVGKHGEDILRFGFYWEGYKQPGDWIAVWNKCWNREFIGDTRFSDVKWWSDIDFDEAMRAKNPKYYDWDIPMYYYNYMREGSISWMNSHDSSHAVRNISK